MTPAVRRHPSGKPLRRVAVKGPQRWRIPDDGYVTPRLQQKELKSAIGFTVGMPADNGDDE
jgi:hypothetical protein